MTVLRVTSGDTYTGVRRLVVTVTDAAGTVDLTGTVLTFMVKRRRSDADADAVLTKTPTLAAPQSGATKGVAYIALDAADTADLPSRSGGYPWELSAVDGVGTITLASGKLYVAADLIVGV